MSTLKHRGLPPQLSARMSTEEEVQGVRARDSQPVRASLKPQRWEGQGELFNSHHFRCTL